MMQLSTPRLILRPWAITDAEVLYEMASDPVIGMSAGWKPHESVEESRSIIETALSGTMAFAIILRATNRPIGCVELIKGTNILRGGPNDAELGYWIGQRYWNQGFATEASREVIRYGFEEAGIERIWCQHLESNPQSARVQNKCGFRQDHRGVFENPYLGEVVAVVSVLTRKDWARAHRSA